MKRFPQDFPFKNIYRPGFLGYIFDRKEEEDNEPDTLEPEISEDFPEPEEKDSDGF
jgi:hypothetical protein